MFNRTGVVDQVMFNMCRTVLIELELFLSNNVLDVHNLFSRNGFAVQLFCKMCRTGSVELDL